MILFSLLGAAVIFFIGLLLGLIIALVIYYGTKKRKVDEYILCAATHYLMLEVVLCGWRHNNIIEQMTKLTGKRSVGTEAEDTTGPYIQGFLTNKGRFVNRTEAMIIAKRSGQAKQPTYRTKTLFSEDLY